MPKFTAIVLAAGKGVRMKSSLPKVLKTIHDRPLIYYILRQLLSVKEVKQIIVVVGFKAKRVIGRVRRDFPKYTKASNKRIEFVYQKALLGTADAVRCAQQKTRYEDALIICADTPLITAKTLKDFIDFYIKEEALGSLISAFRYETNDLGVILRDEQGNVKAICERIDLPCGTNAAEANSGIYAFKTKPLFENLSSIKKNKKKKEYFLTDIVDLFYQKRYKISAYHLDDSEEILGINTQRDLLIAERVLNQRIIESFIERGVKIIDPKSTFIASGVTIGKHCVIYPFTFIEKNVIIGNHCSLGPFAHLREGTTIGDNTSVGNFVEICRSKLGRAVRIKHFSYMGDTTVGNNVNIGAGVVIANYDGKRKNKTTIDNGAFIGSDTVLVAPLKVGKGAITGAGAVVTKNVKAKTVVVGVPAKLLKKV